jgi:transcriptional regulator with XRE-family HTH domain
MRNPKALVQFGLAVRQLRLKAGLSQESLAVRASIHRTYIGGIERGERNPTLLMIYRIASALNLSVQELFEAQAEAVNEIAS